MVNLECDNCGGKDFYKESGYYYCSECQTQSQQVQEQDFEIEESGINKKTTRKIQDKKKSKDENKITSWECYNYIIIGLCNELIQLGAKPELKSVVKILWLRYLEKLQVFSVERDELPRLQAVRSQRDAAIIYGVKRKRRRPGSVKSSSGGSSSNEIDTTTLDSSSMKRERAKKRRALMQAHYDKYTEGATTSGTPSAYNETLQSIQGSSEKSMAMIKPAIKYNIYAVKELNKKLTKNHMKRHRHDLNGELDCHRISGKYTSSKYKRGAHILSLDKIYGTIYLGLLIVQDKITLGDILRFIKEGKISNNYFHHFFPEDYEDKVLNLQKKCMSRLFTHGAVRVKAANIAKFLKVSRYITVPDLDEICVRFCKDMNLPDIFPKLCKLIIIKTKMKMRFSKLGSEIPNYEGRILSIILFLLKLLFGLDGITEYKLSNFAEILNKSSAIDPKMFNLEKWLYYICYRQQVFADYDINYNKEKVSVNLHNLYRSIKRNRYPERKFKPCHQKFLDVLTQVESNLEELQPIEFETTFIPSITHLKTILEDDPSYSKEFLQIDFTKTKLSYILRPMPFLNVLNSIKPVQFMNGGANNNWRVEKLHCLWEEGKAKRKNDSEMICVKSIWGQPKPFYNDNDNKIDSTVFLENFNEIHKLNFEEFRKKFYRKFLKNDEYDLELLKKDLSDGDWDYQEHYTPFQRYWLMGYMSTHLINDTMLKKYLNESSMSFRIVFLEMKRIGNMKTIDFLRTFIETELYLAFYNDDTMRIRTNKYLEHFLKNYQTFW